MKMKGRHYDCMASSDNIISCCYSYCNGNKLKKITNKKGDRDGNG